MRHSMQYQQSYGSVQQQQTQQSQNQQQSQGYENNGYQIEQPSYMKQIKRKSNSPSQKKGIISNYPNSPAPFANSTNNQKNLSLRGNSTHSYYPQPYQRSNTQTSTSNSQQYNGVGNNNSQIQNIPNTMLTGFVSPGKLSPKHQLQMIQQQQSSTMQNGQSSLNNNNSSANQQSSQQAWRRNTFQGTSTTTTTNNNNLNTASLIQNGYQSTSTIHPQSKIYNDSQQAQFKINPSKKIGRQSSQPIQIMQGTNINQQMQFQQQQQQFQPQQQYGLQQQKQPNNNNVNNNKIGYTCQEVDGALTFPSTTDITKYMINGGLDYSQCQFECRLVKQKKVLTNKIKYAYMLNEFFLICNEPYKKIPDKVIELKPNNRIVWDYNRSRTPYRLTGFHLLDGKDVFEYSAEEIVLLKLKEIFSQKLFQARFQDEYEVLAQVGKGNYARVYSIRHRTTGQKFAVKCFEKQKLIGLEKGALSLHNELKIMRNLRDHPNVIKLYEVFEGEHTFYFVMEIVEGTSLYEEIKKHAQNPYKDDEVRDIIAMLIDGIAYCASKNIMHRDIKPENLLFGKVGNQKILKIVDFGLGTYADEVPYIFPKCGTPGFVAPEIANLVDKTQGYSTVCDMFSVGVIFHILLTGEAVFPGKKFNEVLKKNKQCEIDLEKKEYENLSDQAKDLLRRMLEKEPSKRITAVEALQHPYFTQQKLKKAPSTDNLFDNRDDLPAIREKQTSMFTKPLRIPYLTKDTASGSTDDNLSSFITREPMFAGQNQVRQRAESNKMYYTIGSLDRQGIEPNQVSGGAQKDSDKSKFSHVQTGTKQVSEFTPGGRRHKESIVEEHEEDEEGQQKRMQQENEKMEEEH